MQLELHLTKLNVIDRTLEKKTEKVRVGGYQVLCYLKSQKSTISYGQIFTILLGKDILLVNLQIDTEKKFSINQRENMLFQIVGHKINLFVVVYLISHHLQRTWPLLVSFSPFFSFFLILIVWFQFIECLEIECLHSFKQNKRLVYKLNLLNGISVLLFGNASFQLHLFIKKQNYTV